MRTQTRAFAVAAAMVLATLVLGCSDGSNPVTPTPPQTPAAPTPLPSETLYTLSGVVFEATRNGNQPREGVQVYCDSCGSPVGHTSVDTDSNGAYVFTHAKNGRTPLIITKAGYRVVDPSEVYSDGGGVKVAIVNGDTRFDIEIIRE
jgi:hypothetical protein